MLKMSMTVVQLHRALWFQRNANFYNVIHCHGTAMGI